METYTLAVEMYLSAAWTAITDVRTVTPITVSRGIDGSEITDRVARVGTLTFSLDNSQANSAALLSYYSPDSSDCRTGFGIGTLVRLKVTYSGVDYYKFYGRITDISPMAGQYGERYVTVTASDYMNELLVHNMNKVAVQTGQRGDQLLTTIVANLPTAPLNTSYGTGPDIFAYALHDVQDERASAMQAVQRVDQSGLSYTFVKGNTSDGEVLTWQTRHTRLLQASAATFANTMSGLTINRKADSIYNTIKATGYPANVGTTDEVLWTSRQEITLGGGATTTINARYTDPSGAGARVALVPATQITPTSDDYKMSSVTSDAGDNMTSDLSVVVTWGGNTASIALTNNAAVTGYINFLRIRGNIIRLYDPAEIISMSSDSQALYGDRTLTFALPYLDNVNTITAFSGELLTRLKTPFSTVDGLEFYANKSAALMAAAMACDVGSRITLSETVSGFALDDFFVNTYDLIFEPNKVTCKLGNLENAGNTASIGIWGTTSDDSGYWGTSESDSSRWVF